MTNALVPANSSFPSAQEFRNMKEMGVMAVKSGFLPASIKTPEQAVIIMMKGRELGIPPMQAFSSIAVVNGKPTMSAELMLSMIYRNVPGAVVNFVKTDVTECAIEAKRPNGKATTFSFSMDDARKANLTGKGPWVTYPAAMLRARCVSAMARAMFPDALSGVVYTAEELGAEVNEEGEILVETPAKPAPLPPEAEYSDVKTDESPVPAASLAAPTEEPQQSEEPGDFVIRFGRKYKGKKIKEIPSPEIESYLRWLRDTSVRDGTSLSHQVQLLQKNYDAYMDQLRSAADGLAPADFDFDAGTKA
jgi:hypothetical protein